MPIALISIYPEKGKKHGQTGGVASYTKNLVLATARPIYVLCNKTNSRRELYQEGNATVIRCFDKNLKFVWQILKEIKRLEPNVVHIQQELHLFGGILTAYLLQWLILLIIRRKCHVVITLHSVVSLKSITPHFVRENNSHLPSWLVKLAFLIIYKPLCCHVQKIIVHENLFRKILTEEYGVKNQKIFVIPHGVEDFKVIPQETSQKIILFMGYLTGYKGLDLLIDGFALYVKDNPDALLIIGAGKHPKLAEDKEYLNEYQRLFRKAQENISSKNYRWIGFIPEEEIGDYYSAADVSVFPYTISMSSSGPMALSIGYEKPFLASDAFTGVFDNFFLFSRTPAGLSARLHEFFARKKTLVDRVKQLKRERLWPKVALETFNLYK